MDSNKILSFPAMTCSLCNAGLFVKSGTIDEAPFRGLICCSRLAVQLLYGLRAPLS